MASRTVAVNAREAASRAFAAAVSVQQESVAHHIYRVRRTRPEATPAEILRRLELQYIATVSSAGGAVGALAALPSVGTGAALAVSGVEVAGFLEATALYTLAVAEVYGVPVHDLERRRTVLLTVLLGESASKVVEKATGRTGPYWGKAIVKAIPMETINSINSVLGPRFLTKWGTRQGVIVLGRVIPFGVGAAIGGTANAFLARGVVTAVHRGYGPPPDAFPTDLADVAKPDVDVNADIDVVD
jgi:hypothetical protein